MAVAPCAYQVISDEEISSTVIVRDHLMAFPYHVIVGAAFCQTIL